MSRSAPSDLAKSLLNRHGCLRALANQPQAKPELVDSLDIPRSTLDDIVRELEHADLVEYRDGMWQLTLLGQYALDHHTRYKDGLESLTDAAQVFKGLPRDTPVARRFLIGADVHVASGPVPDGVMEVFLDAVESATHVRRATPIVMAGYIDPFFRCATTGSDAHLEIVLPLETFECLRTLHPKLTDSPMAHEDITVFHAEIPATFSLWIADEDQAGLIVYAEHGVRGVIINDTADALNWATAQYDRIQNDAEQIIYHGSARDNPEIS